MIEALNVSFSNASGYGVLCNLYGGARGREFEICPPDQYLRASGSRPVVTLMVTLVCAALAFCFPVRILITFQSGIRIVARLL